MSTVFVHVGQAGCQLAQALWPVLACERMGSPDIFCASRASDGAGHFTPRAILVDAEPKVVQDMFGPAGEPGRQYAFDKSAVAFGQSGRGGNFALGYCGGGGPLGGAANSACPELILEALECARRQVERCHGTCLGIVVMHSMGGGTGSGLGARLVEELREVHPELPLLTTSVLPISTGENPLQSFNSVLSLATMQELADGIILCENDRLLAAADGDRAVQGDDGALAPARGSAGTCGSMSCMNTLLVRDLAPFLCPPLVSQPFDLGEVLANVCPMPTHRFVQAFSSEVRAPNGTFVEARLVVDKLTKGMPKSGGVKESIIMAQSVVRGVHVPDTKSASQGILDRLGGAVSWQPPFGLSLKASAVQLRSAPGTARMATLVNWKCSSQVVRNILARARAKYAARMFLHWYERYGFGRERFEHAFEVLEEALANYDAA